MGAIDTNIGLYSVPPMFLCPQLQIMCCYISCYNVKLARAPGGVKISAH